MNKFNLTGLNKNDIIEADIADNALSGDGVIHYGGATVFVKGAIKGERVRAKIIYAKQNLYFAIIESITVKSEFRVEPPCPYYHRCGGCSMQHIGYPYQLSIKKDLLKTTLDKQQLEYSGIDDCFPSDKQYGYRNKLSLPVQGTPPSIGFFQERSHRIIPVEDCLLQRFDCRKIIEILHGFFLEFKLSGYDENIQKGDVRYVAVRRIGDLTIITLVMTRVLKAALKALNGILETHYGNNYALYVNLNTQNNNVIFSDNFSFIGGNPSKVELMGKTVTVHPASFFQVNEYVSSAIYSAAARLIDEECGSRENRVIIDAYAGAGVLSLNFSRSAGRVYSVENNRQAHLAAVALKQDNGAENLECVLGDCADAVPTIIKKESGKDIVVVLDPPRAGAEIRVLDSLIENPVDCVIYISCNPATLARDLRVLTAAFEIKQITPFDMFPQTGALETLVFLKRK